LLGNNSMLMATMPLAVGVWFYGINASNLSGAVVCAPLLFWCDIVRVAIATHALSVHSTQSVRVKRLVAALNLASA
jgi:hypothetical protein